MKTTFLGDPKCSTVLVITLGMSEDIKVINSSQNQNHHIPPYNYTMGFSGVLMEIAVITAISISKTLRNYGEAPDSGFLNARV